MRTLEELERLAYIEGRVEEARLIAEALDEDRIPCDDCDDAEGHLDDALDALNAVEDISLEYKQDHPMFSKIVDMCRRGRP